MNSIIAWPGGKRNLLKAILPRIPAHRLYVEVFSGSAKVLFAKEPSAGEVINDLNGDLMNFYRVVKHRPAELAEVLEHEVIHPQAFREHLAAAPVGELQQAARFAYLTWYSYGAKGEHFAGGNLKEMLKGQPQRKMLTRIRELLESVSQRLQNVRIEQRDFAEMLARFDSPETFFYLDPPYVHFGNLARYDALTLERREELFTRVVGLSGNFLMSFDDCPEVRALAAQHALAVEEVQTTYALGSTSASRGKVTELFVSKCSSGAELKIAA